MSALSVDFDIILFLKATKPECLLLAACCSWGWMSCNKKWATTCDFQQCGILTSADSDEPVQPPFKLINSKWCSDSSLTLVEYSSDLQRLWSDCAFAQADLRHCRSHIPHCCKSHVAAQINKKIMITYRYSIYFQSIFYHKTSQLLSFIPCPIAMQIVVCLIYKHNCCKQQSLQHLKILNIK